ncbi:MULTISPECIES: DUF3267 domain-containing protein [Sporosarcina]|uniref:DUF3267 domain-containing protein n=1 Tax=Sporosarcina contaminans TaxID=633403 RepID=A0ABW3TXP7_9BACL
MEIQREPDKIIEIDLRKVSLTSIYLSIGSLVFLMVIKSLIAGELRVSFSITSVILFIVGYLLLIVLHELFHLLGFRVFGNVPWKSMIVGVNLKMGVAYATTDKPMTNKAIRKALLLPFWTTGIFPALVGLLLDNGIVLGLAAFLIGGAAGDFAMYKELKELPDDWMVKDDPEAPKLYMYKPNRI